MNDYITKPFTWHRLYSVLLRWMPFLMGEGDDESVIMEDRKEEED